MARLYQELCSMFYGVVVVIPVAGLDGESFSKEFWTSQNDKYGNHLASHREYQV
jgi:hypothetical protein